MPCGTTSRCSRSSTPWAGPRPRPTGPALSASAKQGRSRLAGCRWAASCSGIGPGSTPSPTWSTSCSPRGCSPASDRVHVMRLTVNGEEVEVDDRHATTPLLWVLRDVLGQPGTKFGCGAGYCAACTVLIDGRNEKSCQTPAGRAVGKQVQTVEGVSGPVVDAVRAAWHRENVVQCGYCQPGQTLAAVALLESNPSPGDAVI